MAVAGRAAPNRLLRVGRIGRPHGTRGEFKLEDATQRPELVAEGAVVTVEGVGERRVESCRGTGRRPILRLAETDPRELRGRALLVSRDRVRLEEGEWLIDDLIGCEVPGLGEVTDVWVGPSAEALEIEGGRALVPLVADAIRSVDLEAGRIEVNREYLGI